MDGEGFVLDYAELCGGRSHWVYPQHKLVADLIGTFLRRGGDIRFGMQAVTIEQRDHPQVLCRNVVSGDELQVDCAFVAGCDGFHGAARAAVLPEVCRSFERRYPFAWLAILAAVPPSSEHTIYALHPRGFAGQMLRSPNLTRFYLQVPRGSTIEEWPEDRIWGELRIRLTRDGWQLTEGPIVGRSLLELRSSVVEPMQYGRLFLVGDAAHILTPAGGKGMNLALQDAEELALRLLTFYATRDQEPLSGYSAACLARIWHAQEFSNWMIEVLHASSNEQPDGGYMHRIQQARLSHLRSSHSFATNFAENYVGLQ
jgi:p-hydroxybenzoate 3-monooxygenase